MADDLHLVPSPGDSFSYCANPSGVKTDWCPTELNSDGSYTSDKVMMMMMIMMIKILMIMIMIMMMMMIMMMI